MTDQFGGIYRNRRILLTGHTGFKGSYLAFWLRKLGAELRGVSLEPETNPSHFELLKLEMDSRCIDLRDRAAIRADLAAAVGVELDEHDLERNLVELVRLFLLEP